MPVRRERTNQIFDPVLRVEHTALKADKLVYLLVANKPIWYGRDYSRVVYVGTTEKGLRRIAGSTAYRVKEAIDKLRGIRRLEAYVIWCKPRRKVRMWRKLERAILLAFREVYGRVPMLNSHGKKIKETNEFKLFSRKAITRIVRRYG